MMVMTAVVMIFMVLMMMVMVFMVTVVMIMSVVVMVTVVTMIVIFVVTVVVIFMVLMMMVMVFMMAVFSIMMMVAAFRTDLCLPQQFLGKIILSFHHGKDLPAGDILPRRGDDRGTVVEGADQLNGLLQLVFLHILGTA